MKAGHIIAAGSLALNAGFLTLFLVSPGAPDAVTAAGGAPSSAGNPAGKAADSGVLNSGTWDALRAGDLHAQAARLQAQGFPPAMVRAIMAARIREASAGRRRDFDAARNAAPYWRAETLDPKLQAEATALSREESRQLKELLGEEPENGPVAQLRRQLPTIPAAKLEQIAAIQERFNQRRADVGPESYNAIDREMAAEFARVLTPLEMEEYEMRAGRIASSLRSQLVAFEPTEQEFRTIVRLTSAFGDLLAPMYAIPPADEMRLRDQAQAQLNQQIKEAFGEARYVEYTRGRDGMYRQTTQLTDRLGLPRGIADQLYDLQQAYQQQQTALLRGATPGAPPSAEERSRQAAALAALRTEGQEKAMALLGAHGFEAYKEYGGRWMQAAPVRTLPAPPGPAAPAR
jgi:hypothetical protein